MSQAPAVFISASMERSLLGAILMDAPRVIEVMDARRAGAELFAVPSHQKTYQAIRDLEKDVSPVDVGNVVQWLRDHQRLDECGGYEAIEGFLDACPTAAHAEFFLDDLHERFIRRAMARELDKARFDVANPDESAEIVRGKIESSFACLQATTTFTQKSQTALLDEQEQMYRLALTNGCAGIRSGFRWWDEHFGGLMPKVFYVVSGTAGCFKTTLVRNIAEHVAGGQGLRVDFASLEQSAGQILASMTARMAGVYISELNAGRSSEALTKWAAQKAIVASWPVFICDEPQTEITLWSWARRAKSKGSRLLILDYLQFVTCSDTRATEEQRIARASSAVRRIAMELDIPVIAIASESNEGKLRHSGQTLYDCFCHVQMRKNEDEMGKVLGAHVAIKKNRFGQQLGEFQVSHYLGVMGATPPSKQQKNEHEQEF